jgi:hypothetical protein
MAGTRYCGKGNWLRRKPGETHTTETLRERCEVKPATDCWEWMMSFNSHGYGQVRHAGESYLAHRLMFSLCNPDMNMKGVFVCHHCDNPACINPIHLYAGTPLSNMRDRRERKRAGYAGHPGEEHPSAKLTEELVVEIRRRHAQGGIGYRNLGKIYGVDRTVIRGIVKGKYWKNVAV